MAASLQFGDQREARIHTAVRNNPRVISTERLTLVFRFSSSFEQGVAKSNSAFQPHVLRVGAPELLKIRQPFQQVMLDWPAIQMHDAGETAHDASDVGRGNALSKVA
jgi:hypothetical protein